jgi:hypothetical protein
MIYITVFYPCKLPLSRKFTLPVARAKCFEYQLLVLVSEGFNPRHAGPFRSVQLNSASQTNGDFLLQSSSAIAQTEAARGLKRRKLGLIGLVVFIRLNRFFIGLQARELDLEP